ncbi:MAG: lysostaphin resistance A-like protein [Candidatus Methylomirabilales bacterium]
MESAVNPDSVKPRAPWGFWATTGFSFIIGGVFFGIQAIVLAVFVGIAVSNNPDLAVPAFISDLRSNGLFLAVATCVSSPICIGLTIVCVRLRRGWSVREYLALGQVPREVLLKWLGLTLLFAIGSDALTLLIGREIVPDFVARTYETASFPLLLWTAFVVAAPAFEEIFFRGFMFRGLQHSWVGPIGAVILTSVIFGVIHFQYDAYGIATALAIGVLLGTARLKTESLYPPIAMHALINLVATLEAAVL